MLFNNKMKATLLVIVVTIIIILLIITRTSESFANSQQLLITDCIPFVPFVPTPIIPIKPGTIFISIASYRDVECAETVSTIYKLAANPYNVFLGLCEQNKENELDELCTQSGTEKYRKNMKKISINYLDAKGPTFARYHCAKLWNGEQYFLQIDSHTFFEKNWDTNLINMLEQCRKDPQGSNRPVLSVYPPTEEQLKMDGFPIMDSGKVGKNGLPIFLASFWTKYSSERPLRSPKPFVAAGFLFLDSTFLYDVPYDPMLCHLFQGEETLLSARLFTNGYDIFAPNIKVCSHHYQRRSSPLFHKEVPDAMACRKFAENKVKRILGLKGEGNDDEGWKIDNGYGLGTFRTLNDFWNASGIILENGGISNANYGIVSIEPWSRSDVVSPQFKGWNFYESGYEKIKKWT
jgi:[Skp1-protein]-hydroxyproline N-acetylglucosaminyltransferase